MRSNLSMYYSCTYMRKALNSTVREKPSSAMTFIFMVISLYTSIDLYAIAQNTKVDA